VTGLSRRWSGRRASRSRAPGSSPMPRRSNTACSWPSDSDPCCGRKPGPL
jgi:hypothetical protein